MLSSYRFILKNAVLTFEWKIRAKIHVRAFRCDMRQIVMVLVLIILLI